MSPQQPELEGLWLVPELLLISTSLSGPSGAPGLFVFMKTEKNSLFCSFMTFYLRVSFTPRLFRPPVALTFQTSLASLSK